MKQQGRRIMSIWLMQLAIDHWRHDAIAEADNASVALTSDTVHGPRVVAVNALALEAGVTPGTRLADARALCPALVAYPYDAAADRALLEKLALWAQRWGPLTAIDPPDALLVDITGASHLFGGEEALAGLAVRELSSRGLAARVGIAGTAGAAWAMSHYGLLSGIIAEDANPHDHLAPLPVGAMRLDEDVCMLLARLGLKRIGELAEIGRDALARRFRNRRAANSNPLIRLDQLLGITPEPLLPVVAKIMPMVQRRLVEPLAHRSLLDRILADLATDMQRLLEGQRLGARRLVLRLWRVDGATIERKLELASATREAAHITRLFATKLDDIDAGFGIDQAQLLSPWAEPLALVQSDIEQGVQSSGTSLAQYLDRIAARLGAGAAARPVPHASHYPERSQRYRPPLTAQLVSQGQLALHARPLKLLDRPEAITVIYDTPEGQPRSFRWRGNLHSIALAEGPERIAPEWWRERSTARLRDYYRVEDELGRSYWIYRHGRFGDRQGQMPLWYIQGIG